MPGYAETAATVLTSNLYQNHTGRHDVIPADVDEAQQAAIELIIMAGFDAQDSDYFGAEMGDTVQSLLTVVILRCPQLRNRLIDGEISHEAGIAGDVL